MAYALEVSKNELVPSVAMDFLEVIIATAFQALTEQLC